MQRAPNYEDQSPGAKRQRINVRRRERYATETGYRLKIADRAKAKRPRLNYLKTAGRVRRPTSRIFESAKGRAKDRGIPFTITERDIVIPTVCPIDGLPFARGVKGPHPRSPSLDCIIPKLGYVPGNIAVISFHWNRLKCTMTAADLRRLLAYIESHSA